MNDMTIVPFPQMASPAGRPRLAVISTSSRLCGIAAYTDALCEHLRDLFEVEVFNLDQYLLRSTHPRVRKIGDRHIKEICTELGSFDAVNVQLEHGTLGRRAHDVCRRFGWIVEAAPRLSVAFHSLPPPAVLDRSGILAKLARMRLAGAWDVWRGYRRARIMSNGVIDHLRRAQHNKPVTAIAHNRHDRCELEHLYGIDNVLDHPLAFMSPAGAETTRARSGRSSFPTLDNLPDDAVLIGVFGFLNDYKGFGTAIRALHHLPDNHHVLIFGGVHPNEIAPRQPIHPYLSSLFRDAYVDTSLYEEISGGGDGTPGITLAGECLAELLGTHPRDVSKRVHFMGAPDDRDFLAGMSVCDAVVLPYLEVGQSSSGPLSQALELGCRVIASRTRTFLEFARYHPDTIEFFDIGNYLELAHRLRSRRRYPPRALAYNVETNKAVYLRANTSMGAPEPIEAAVRLPETAQAD